MKIRKYEGKRKKLDRNWIANSASEVWSHLLSNEDHLLT
jgi:hypothetical protein